MQTCDQKTMSKGWFLAMENNAVKICNCEDKQDVLNILMDSSLYLELALNERYLLLKRIVEYYRGTIVQNVV